MVVENFLLYHEKIIRDLCRSFNETMDYIDEQSGKKLITSLLLGSFILDAFEYYKIEYVDNELKTTNIKLTNVINELLNADLSIAHIGNILDIYNDRLKELNTAFRDDIEAIIDTRIDDQIEIQNIKNQVNNIISCNCKELWTQDNGMLVAIVK